MATKAPSRFIDCGKIINTHGCHGDVKVEPWTDTPRDLIDLGRVFVGDGDEKKEMKILRGSVMQGRFLMLSLEGVTDMNAADALRNAVLYAAREDFDLEEGQYFLADAIGLPAMDARAGREGNLLGTVTDITPNAASDIYTVKTPDGTEVLVPAIPVFITEVKPGEYVRMTPIDGMFENRDGDKETN
ncbi:MAG: 16S rRNA processing protein RimM [Clostridia bacterium]|nr:16S rRNA processing protein RimM [Clostridia bacterium]MBP3666990.1 16S rRNA processing protein RimM [Clostridia bacterium]